MNNSTAPSGLRRLIGQVFYAGCSSSEIDRRNTRRLNVVSFTWALTYVAAAWFLRGEYTLSTPAVSLLIGIPALLGIAMLWSYVRFLRETDELMRKIHLEAIATGFGVTILTAITYALLEANGAPPLELNWIIAIGIFGYMFGVITGMRRYK